MNEQQDASTPNLVHRYHDKALFLPLDVCSIYCRFCTRSYSIGPEAGHDKLAAFRASMKEWQPAFAYLALRPEIEDVVISGGDTYNLSASRLRLIGETLLGIPCIRSKVTVYARAEAYAQWLQQGFRKEAIIRSFFRDGADAHLWTIYPDAARCRDVHAARHARILSQALARDRVVERQPLPASYVSQSAVEKHAWDLAALLRDTFDDYPTPIHGAYIKDQIAAGRNCFRIIRDGDGALAAASAEMDFQRMTAELTDCMTRPADRGRGLMSRLLCELEHALLKEHGIRHFYSIARADEVGINCVFAKCGYEFTGRLINNCRMPNGWESMNVWCKAVDAA